AFLLLKSRLRVILAFGALCWMSRVFVYVAVSRGKYVQPWFNQGQQDTNHVLAGISSPFSPKSGYFRGRLCLSAAFAPCVREGNPKQCFPTVQAVQDATGLRSGRTRRSCSAQPSSSQFEWARPITPNCPAFRTQGNQEALSECVGVATFMFMRCQGTITLFS
ncbi:unnamed protein product, partial [Hapterophycus canaliculatus]